MSRKTAALITAIDSLFEVSNDGADWAELPYVGDISVSGGEAPETDIVTLRAIGKIAGRTRPPTLSVQIPSLFPNHPAVKVVRLAQSGGDPIQIRLTTPERELFAAAADVMAAIAADGEVTFSGSGTKPNFKEGSPFGVGYVIRIGSNSHTISTISESTDGTITVTVDTRAVVAAAQFSIVAPSLRLGPIIGRVRSGPTNNFNLTTEGVLEGTLEVSLGAALGEWAIVTS